jgi:hypothetical protein
MTPGSRRDDDLEPRDPLDRAIDETLGAAMRAHTVDLRERVLARLDEPAGLTPAWLRFVLRPALLPAAGAALVVVGVALTWQHVDDTLARTGAPRHAPAVAGTRAHAAVTPKPKTDAAVTPGGPTVARAGAAVAGATAAPTRPARHGVNPAGGDVLAAASLLDMDAMSAPAKVGANIVINGDDVEPAPLLPGAIGGDLGDPIKPMPPLRPIVIQPIVTAPIVVAPPVSTLAPAVETIPTVGDLTRDPSDPGKPGGVRQ